MPSTAGVRLCPTRQQSVILPTPRSVPNPELETGNPYTAPVPAGLGSGSQRWPASLMIAICIWPMLTAKLFFLGLLFKTQVSELSLPISSENILLIHAMTPLVLLTATASILSGAINLKRPSQHRKLGQIRRSWDCLYLALRSSA